LEELFAARLKDLQPPDSGDRVTYFLHGKEVCRGFFKNCLGVTKDIVNAISGLVRGKEPSERIRKKLPKYECKTPQYGVCVAFWVDFFGDRAQTSGDGHRYFPVNHSSYLIYQFFLALVEGSAAGHWEEAELLPGADPDLHEAVVPHVVAFTPTDLDAMMAKACQGLDKSAVEEKDGEEHEYKREEEKQPQFSRLSEEAEMLLDDHPDNAEVIEDIIQEREAMEAIAKRTRISVLLNFYARPLRRPVQGC
jgi:hypothetical protein